MTTTTTTTRKQLEVVRDDQSPQKWCVLLREDVFRRFMAQGSTNPTVQKVFGGASFFCPLLFGKFFDPSDAFPLWEFESDILLSGLRSSGQTCIDWFQTDQDYVLKLELPGEGKNNVQVYAENGKVVEISGQWKQQQGGESNSLKSTKDWRSGNWWEHGYVRRLELPQDADSRRIEASLTNDLLLELKVHKINKPLDSNDNAKDKDPM
ncbi:21.7 kDa class VI heat shock protein-like [Pyrus ussuriensis x Pyrus communis]|uniref:21.7 kDa class VI heat shock protein-like n=1 Tax=Pyrus ussuriensis x Pyrus communis TaxID=2448454 RepID=A0A5N5FW82_9ROSA|nr:21.7 kDa class VI heat shock protein-like [Pyrus ussuriensis x Pyrus communis]